MIEGEIYVEYNLSNILNSGIKNEHRLGKG